MKPHEGHSKKRITKDAKDKVLCAQVVSINTNPQISQVSYPEENQDRAVFLSVMVLGQKDSDFGLKMDHLNLRAFEFLEKRNKKETRYHHR